MAYRFLLLFSVLALPAGALACDSLQGVAGGPDDTEDAGSGDTPKPSKDSGGAPDPGTVTPAGDAGTLDEGDASVPDTGTISTACTTTADGVYCGNTVPTTPGIDPTDLVTCNGGKLAKVDHCTGACHDFPVGEPDECDPCPGVTNGFYCGKDLPTLSAAHATLRIHCLDGGMLGNVACASGLTCTGPGPTASCQ